MTFGLTAAGFTPKREQDILSDLNAGTIQEFGDVRTDADSVFGQFNGVSSKPLLDLWELANAVFYSRYVSTAQGIALDYAVSGIGISRLSPTYTAVYLNLCSDSSPVTVPANTVYRDTNMVEFIQRYVAIITLERTNFVRLEIPTVTVDDVFILTIDSVTQTITAVAGDTPAIIIAAFAALFTSVTIVQDTDTEFTIEPVDADTFSLVYAASSDNMNLILLSTPVQVFARSTGVIAVAANTLNSIVTPVAGLDSVFNPADGITGRGVETDAELRIRFERSASRIGTSTVDAIRARILQEVPGATSCYVFENDQDVVVDSRPPHSYEILVDGSFDDQVLAEKIWEVKGGGITTFSRTDDSATVYDTMNFPHLVSWSQPIIAEIAVICYLTKFAEELFPVDEDSVKELLKQVIYDFGSAEFTIGKNIIPQRFVGPVYLNVPGIGSVVVYVSKNGATPVQSIVAIDSYEVSIFSLDRIHVHII